MIAAVKAAARGFREHDGLALSMQFAVSALLALFPFFMLLEFLGGLFGKPELVGIAQRILFMSWPSDIARPLVAEAQAILSDVRGQGLLLPALLAPLMASNALEVLRTGLIRAYDAEAARPRFLQFRLQSIALALAAAAALVLVALAIGFLFDLPAAGTRLQEQPETPVNGNSVAFLTGLAGVVAGIFLASRYFPARRFSVRALFPGVFLALALTAAGMRAMDFYAAQVSDFGTTYGGFAAALLALLVLGIAAGAILFGAEVNRALLERR